MPISLEKCWICGVEGTSREHLTKASDLKSLRFQATQLAPMYYHTKAQKNVPIKSGNSDRLKSRKKSLCSRCNGATTQPFDRAWEKLQEMLSTVVAQQPLPSFISVKSAFGSILKRQRVAVQLFFLKHLVIRLIDEDKYDGLDIKLARQCIRDFKAHPSLYLRFGYRMQYHNSIGLSEIEETYDKVDKAIARLMYDYRVGRVAVRVIYLSHPKLSPFYDRTMWHPTNITQRIYIQQFRY